MKPVVYAQQQLASTGFVLVDSVLASELRADLFPSGLDASTQFAEARQRNAFTGLRGSLVRLTATIAGRSNPVELIARSTDRLQQRIRELTGYEVTSLKPAAPVEAEAERAARQARAGQSAGEHASQIRLAKLRQVAQQELPLHDCPLRRDILGARRTLAQHGGNDTGFVPS